MIYLIITTSIFNIHGRKRNLDLTHRKDRYIECIKQVLTLSNNDPNVKPIVVENNGLTESYLDELGCDIVYTNHNNTKLRHKGFNELLDIKHVLDKYDVQDEDMVIKLTGRYKLLDSHFIDEVKAHTEYDAFIKFFNVCTKKFHTNYDDCVLGLIAIRCKYLKDFHYDGKKSPEVEFSLYVKNVVKNFMEIKDLNLQCCFANDLRILVV